MRGAHALGRHLELVGPADAWLAVGAGLADGRVVVVAGDHAAVDRVRLRLALVPGHCAAVAAVQLPACAI